VLPAVVIDLSDQASAQSVEWVVRACNEAIAEAECVAEGAELLDPPLAVAIVRLADGSGERIRIEVGRGNAPETAWSVRELRFRVRDPEAERWRAVGLAIATLVGEFVPPDATVEAGSAAAAPGALPPAPVEAASGPAEVAIASAPAGAASAASESAVVVPPASQTDAEADESREPARERQPQPSLGAFIGLGVVAGPALSEQGWRWGGGGRVGWVFSPGWLVALSGSYSRHDDAEDSLAVSWLHLALGIGRRFELAPAWGAAVSAGGGARQIGLEAEVNGTSARSQRWNPYATLGGELWWQLHGGLALWAALDLNGLATASRMFVGGTEKVALPRIDAVGVLGLRWMP